MKPINLFTLSRVGDTDAFYIFEKLLSGRSDILQKRTYEKECIKDFVEIILAFDKGHECLEPFYYSFEIPQHSSLEPLRCHILQALLQAGQGRMCL